MEPSLRGLGHHGMPGEDVPTVSDVAQQEEVDQQEAEEGEGERDHHPLQGS